MYKYVSLEYHSISNSVPQNQGAGISNPCVHDMYIGNTRSGIATWMLLCSDPSLLQLLLSDWTSISSSPEYILVRFVLGSYTINMLTSELQLRLKLNYIDHNSMSCDYIHHVHPSHGIMPRNHVLHQEWRTTCFTRITTHYYPIAFPTVVESSAWTQHITDSFQHVRITLAS